MSGIGLGNRLRPFRQAVARQRRYAFVGGQRRRISPEFNGQGFVQADQYRLAGRRRLPADIEVLQVADVGIVEGKEAGGRGVHRNWAVWGSMAGRSDLSSIVALRVVQAISMRMGGFGSPAEGSQ